MSRIRVAAAIADQGLVSAAGFVCVVLGARWMAPAEFAAFVLAVGAIAVAVGLQHAALIEPALARMAGAPADRVAVRAAAARLGGRAALAVFASTVAGGGFAALAGWSHGPLVAAAGAWAAASMQLAQRRRLAASSGLVAIGPAAAAVCFVLLVGSLAGLHAGGLVSAAAVCLAAALASACAAAIIPRVPDDGAVPHGAPWRLTGYVGCSVAATALNQGFFVCLAWYLLYARGPDELAGYKAMEVFAVSRATLRMPSGEIRLVDAAQVAILSVAASGRAETAARLLPLPVLAAAVAVIACGSHLEAALYGGRYREVLHLLALLVAVPVVSAMSLAPRLRLQTALRGGALLRANAVAFVAGSLVAIPGVPVFGGICAAAGTIAFDAAMLITLRRQARQP